MQKELGRYLLPVFRKKYKTDLHLKKYPPNLFEFAPKNVGSPSDSFDRVLSCLITLLRFQTTVKKRMISLKCA